ncbi:MAG TPA: DUF2795 domain-containing protein [Magnetospirillum sp.]|nr:DUF2795 domain-containing protein [Magnetospirillum sp.]
MAQFITQALVGLSFPCNRAQVLRFAANHDISPRAMDFLQRLPEQQFANMTELVTALPSKNSLRDRGPIEVDLQVAPEPGKVPLDKPIWGDTPLTDKVRPDPAQAQLFALMDPFGLTRQWQQIWFKTFEGYTRLFMPWHR